MTASERRAQILAMLRQNNFIKIADIVNQFDISNETARRDLDYLQNQKHIRRIHGGAILREAAPTADKLSFAPSDELSAIGKAAADMILPGESVFLGTGSTVLQIARHLRGRSNVTVVTNSLTVINELVDSEITLFALGGMVTPDERAIISEYTANYINQFYCDKAFLGCGGLTMEMGVMDFSHYIPPHRYFIARSKQHILVAANAKFGIPAFISACPLEDIDVIITDSGLSEDYQIQLRECGIDLVLADVAAYASAGKEKQQDSFSSTAFAK